MNRVVRQSHRPKQEPYHTTTPRRRHTPGRMSTNKIRHNPKRGCRVVMCVCNMRIQPVACGWLARRPGGPCIPGGQCVWCLSSVLTVRREYVLMRVVVVVCVGSSSSSCCCWWWWWLWSWWRLRWFVVGTELWLLRGVCPSV